jgi:hypothetical protein
VWGEAGEESRTAACLIRQVRLHSLRECGGERMGLAEELRECRPAVANGEARKAETVRTETRTEATEKLDAVTGCRHPRDRRALVAALCASHILLVQCPPPSHAIWGPHLAFKHDDDRTKDQSMSPSCF